MHLEGQARPWLSGEGPEGSERVNPRKDAGILRAAAQRNHANVGVYADVIAGGAIRRGDPVKLA